MSSILPVVHFLYIMLKSSRWNDINYQWQSLLLNRKQYNKFYKTWFWIVRSKNNGKVDFGTVLVSAMWDPVRPFNPWQHGRHILKDDCDGGGNWYKWEDMEDRFCIWKYIACCSIVLTDNVFNFASICEKNILPTELRNQNMKPKFFDSRERKCSLLLKVMWNPLLMSLRKNQSKFGNWLTNHILNHEVCSPPFFFDL